MSDSYNDGQIIIFPQDLCSKKHEKKIGIMPGNGDGTLRAGIYCNCDYNLHLLFDSLPNPEIIISVEGTAWRALEILLDEINSR